MYFSLCSSSSSQLDQKSHTQLQLSCLCPLHPPSDSLQPTQTQDFSTLNLVFVSHCLHCGSSHHPSLTVLPSSKASSSVWRNSNVAYFLSHVFSRLIWQLSPLSHRSLHHFRACNRSHLPLCPHMLQFSPVFVLLLSCPPNILSSVTISLVSKLIFCVCMFVFPLPAKKCLKSKVVERWEDKFRNSHGMPRASLGK